MKGEISDKDIQIKYIEERYFDCPYCHNEVSDFDTAIQSVMICPNCNEEIVHKELMEQAIKDRGLTL